MKYCFRNTSLVALALGLFSGLTAGNAIGAIYYASGVSGPTTVNEGSGGSYSVSVGRNSSSGPTGTSLQVVFDYSGGETAPSPSSNGTSFSLAIGQVVTRTFSTTFRDSGVGNVRYYASSIGSTGGNPYAYLNVTVNNVAPTLQTFSVAGTATEGSSIGWSVSSTDPGLDTVTYEATGSATGTIGSSSAETGTRSANGSFSYAQDGTYTYTVRARDSDGALGNGITRTVVVSNVAPILETFALTSNTINEGDTVGWSMASSDPGADSVNYQINGSAAGSSSATSGLRTSGGTLAYADDGVFSLVGVAVDSDGASSSTITQTLTVLNVDPTISSITGDQTINFRDALAFSALATDPGVNDVLVYQWDLDDDGLYDDYSGTSGSTSFAAPGEYTVGLLVTDGDGGQATSSFNITAVPVPSSGALLASLLVAAGLVPSRRRALGSDRNSAE